MVESCRSPRAGQTPASLGRLTASVLSLHCQLKNASWVQTLTTQLCNQYEKTDLVAGGKVVCQLNQFSKLLSVCHVFFSADQVISGHCQMHVPVFHSQRESASGVLEHAVSFMEQQSLLIAHPVCSMEKEAVESGYSIHLCSSSCSPLQSKCWDPTPLVGC